MIFRIAAYRTGRAGRPRESSVPVLISINAFCLYCADAEDKQSSGLRNTWEEMHERVSPRKAQFVTFRFPMRHGAVARSASKQGHCIHRGRARRVGITRFLARARAFDGTA